MKHWQWYFPSYPVMGFDRFARTCYWNSFNPENRLLAYVRSSQFFPMNTFYLWLILANLS